jgi:cytochrome o ubiquinol oxidase subunit 1
MGAGANVNAIFGMMTMIIAVPTGVKVFNWLFTLYGGRIRFGTPVLWTIGFMVTFVIGGMTGVLLAVPPADFVLHNSLFLVAHFHNVIIGGVLFGAFAGYTYWFPKAFGFKLHERLGQGAFWCWLVGFYIAFMPLYYLGLLGMTRRMQHYDVAAWHPWLIVAAVGAVVILAGIGLLVAQLVVSIRRRQALRDETGDPWDGRSLEWATASPPPAFNFAVLPNVHGEEAYWGMKQRVREQHRLGEAPAYEDIEVPRNSPTGVICAFFATMMGFSLIWHIWWMAGFGALGAFATLVIFAWRDRAEYRISAEAVARVDAVNRTARSQQDRTRLRPRPRGPTVVPEADATASRHHDPHRVGHGRADAWPVPGHGTGGPASKRIIVGYGFWIFLLSDIVMFAAFFATYAVLVGNTAGGPKASELFDLRNVAVETACLLVSSFTCGLAGIAARARNTTWFYATMSATFMLGAAFLGLEVRDFADLVERGAGPTRSAFLSAFFTLVGCHGLHVTVGLLWVLIMMAQVFAKSFREDILRRLLCFSLFWHALDIIWVAVFTVVYLMGVQG